VRPRPLYVFCLLILGFGRMIACGREASLSEAPEPIRAHSAAKVGSQSPQAPEVSDQEVECPPEVDKAVLTQVYRRLGDLGGDCQDMTFERLRCLQEDLEKLRRWSAALSDRCVSASYAGWLDHFDEQGKACANEVKTHKGKHGFALYEEQQEIAERRQRKWEVSHPLPKPPEREPCSQR
jgi:hypothetical protein